MIATPAPLQEKMTLFWHGHFTSAYEGKGITAQDILTQNQLYRSYALGNIRKLTLAVSHDPAMLKYLDNRANRAQHPNENYARELMELFTLGIGNYTEQDVRESARAFTGYTLDADDQFVFNPRQHDDGSKTFLGQTGNFTGDDIVNIIFQQPAAAQYFAKKLLEFYVYSDPEPQLVDARRVATEEELLRPHAGDVGAVAQQRLPFRSRVSRARQEPDRVRRRQLQAVLAAAGGGRSTGFGRDDAHGSTPILSAERQGLGWWCCMDQQWDAFNAGEPREHVVRESADDADGDVADAGRIAGSESALDAHRNASAARRHLARIARTARRLSQWSRDVGTGDAERREFRRTRSAARFISRWRRPHTS